MGVLVQPCCTTCVGRVQGNVRARCVPGVCVCMCMCVCVCVCMCMCVCVCAWRVHGACMARAWRGTCGVARPVEEEHLRLGEELASIEDLAVGQRGRAILRLWDGGELARGREALPLRHPQRGAGTGRTVVCGRDEFL